MFNNREISKKPFMLTVFGIFSLLLMGISLQPIYAAEPLGKNPAGDKEVRKDGTFMRFEVQQTLKKDFHGRLSLQGNDFQEETTFVAGVGQTITPYLIFPESMGKYTIELTDVSNNEIALKLSGQLSRQPSGAYGHRLITGWADQDTFLLEPTESGVVIALGSVSGFIRSCVELRSPISVNLAVGIDKDGDGELQDESEFTNENINTKDKTCVETPESTLPLTSHYSSKLTNSYGTVIARNEGVYDFLNKSSVNSKKDSVASLVRVFEVTFVRTPLASSVLIPNMLISPPEEIIEVIPQNRESTSDTIIQDDGTAEEYNLGLATENTKDTVDDTETELQQPLSEPTISPGNRHLNKMMADILRGSWGLIALSIGLTVVAGMVVKSYLHTHRHKS